MPQLPSLQLGDYLIAVDSITGHGAETAALSVRRRQPGVKPGRAVVAASDVDRDSLVRFAIQLLDLAEQMVDTTAYSTSDSLPRLGNGHVTRRLGDAHKRSARLRDRLPILQLMQRVLERCDDRVATTFLMLLANAEATGTLPIRAEVDFKAARDQTQAVTPRPNS